MDRNEGKLDADLWVLVALRKESVDRNCPKLLVIHLYAVSLSARRAWIEILSRYADGAYLGRSPQGERG